MSADLPTRRTIYETRVRQVCLCLSFICYYQLNNSIVVPSGPPLHPQARPFPLFYSPYSCTHPSVLPPFRPDEGGLTLERSVHLTTAAATVSSPQERHKCRATRSDRFPGKPVSAIMANQSPTLTITHARCVSVARYRKSIPHIHRDSN